MPEYLSPSVQVREVDESAYVQGSSSSVAGVVGIADKGPIGSPTLVTSWPQFVEVFGSYRADSELAYAAKGFFDNGGRVLWVVRTVHYTDPTDPNTASAVEAFALLGTATTEALRVSEATPGSAEGYSAALIANGSLWDVEITDADGNLVEAVRKVSFTAGSDNYVETVGARDLRTVVLEDLGEAPAAGSGALAGGDDGLTGLVDADFIGDEAGATGLWALAAIDSLRLVAIPGEDAPEVVAALNVFEEKLKTVFGLSGTPGALTPAEVLDYRNGEGSYVHAAFNTSYHGLYWPRVRVYDPRTQLSNLYISPVGHLLGLFANNDRVANFWDAPAGLKRGLIRGVLGVEYRSTAAERDTLYPEGVNVIANFKGDGVVVWGQRTLQSTASATDRINVRRLLIQLRYDLQDFARGVLFEPNNKRTWEAFKRKVNPYLDRVRDGGGLYNFLVVCDESTNTAWHLDRNIMVAKLFIQPTKTAEFMEIPLIITESGVDFGELLAA